MTSDIGRKNAVLRLITLFSGSSGNCTAVCCENDILLIDAGRSARAIETRLNEVGLDISNVRAVFITHEHVDHVSAVAMLTKKHRIKIHAANETADSIADRCCFDTLCRHDVIFSERIGCMNVSSFHTSHDARCSVGYRIDASLDGSEKTVSVGLVTDTGIVTDEIKSSLLGCRAVVLESNHDIKMLLGGVYPPYLKKRVNSKHGHLSNNDSAKFAAELVAGGTGELILAHLSKENNTPERALNCCLEQLKAENLNASVKVAPPDIPCCLSVE